MEPPTPTSSRRSPAAPDVPAHGTDGHGRSDVVAADRPTRPDEHDASVQIGGCAWANGQGTKFEGLDAVKSILEDPQARVWVDVVAPADVDLTDLARVLQLHPLVAGDIAERNQRAKVTQVEGAIHVVLFWIAYEGEVSEVEIDIVLGPRTLLTVHEAGFDLRALPQLRQDGTALLKKGADFLLYAITDGIVDGYFPVLDKIEDEIDDLQDAVVRTPTTWTLERLFTLKRELIGLRRAITPSREVFNQLTNRDDPLIAPEHVVYFRDVYDHLIRVTDELDNDRELVAGTLEVYLSTVNNNLSIIMKRLTGVTVILAGIGAVAGIFGMSEAGAALGNGESGGFWVITGMVVLGAAATALVLRRIDWI
jgi:magnesium transporter